MLDLRYEILRKPLGLNFTADDLIKEEKDIFIGCFEEDELIGCCSLVALDAHSYRLRQMAVKDNFQRKGVGKEIIQFSENYLREKGVKTLLLYAREVAIDFYEKIGYVKEGQPFEEVGLVHYLMRKNF